MLISLLVITTQYTIAKVITDAVTLV